jgi:hypothetical protein
MELEKIATELAQKAVAARHSNNPLKPGEYPAWASEFRKLAQEHYAELAMTKQAEDEAPGSYNPYSMYDKAVTPDSFMANPVVRNALVTGGLGAGVGALGSLASNLFSRKRKKRYLSDALSAGLMGGLAGGVGGAGYTALNNDKATTDFTNKALGALGIGTVPKLSDRAVSERDKVIDSGKKLTYEGELAQKGLYAGAAANLLRNPVGSTLAGRFSGNRRTTADTAQMLSNAEQRLSAFRDSVKDVNKKGVPTGNRQAIVNAWMHEHNLMPDKNTGVISIKDPRHLAAAMQDLDSINKRMDPTSGRAISSNVDINKLRQEVMGIPGASGGPGVIQSFKNPELAAQRLGGADAGKVLKELYPRTTRPWWSQNIPPQPAGPRSGAITSYRSGFKGPTRGQFLTSLGMAGAGYAMPNFAQNLEARSEGMGQFLDNLRSSVSSTTKNPLPAEELARRLSTIDNMRQGLEGELTRADVNKLFNQLGNAGVFEGAGAGK